MKIISERCCHINTDTVSSYRYACPKMVKDTIFYFILSMSR